MARTYHPSMSRDRLEILGNRIRELREERKITQATLAERADLSTNYIGEIERGKAQATLESLFSIVDALEVNPSLLFMPLDGPQDREGIIKQIRELLDQLEEL
ncbi:helix-turn-helix domain-containing protein [Acidobacteria bacterium AH-259-D05]|nr:helix-turn-helix domain-containing protein [Acidobacteria bacterium AH-259-D05]